MLRKTGLRGKTAWDWLQLLIVPFALAGIGYWFTMQQDARQQQIEEQRAQDAALQAYLDQMSTLLLEKDLRSAEGDSEVRTLARARTLTVLRALDPSSKTVVIQFLVEAGLVQGAKGIEPVVRLSDADLSGVQLVGADLGGAHLHDAVLSDVVLSGADLVSADLSFADLRRAMLIGADLSGAGLREASLSEFGLTADLSGVDLSTAWLADAKVTQKQLAQASTLQNATMPNGQKYEEWLGTPIGQDWLRKYKEVPRSGDEERRRLRRLDKNDRREDVA